MKVLSIAFNTFRENLRDKLLYNLLIFALLMIGSSLLLMRLTLGEFHRLLLDVSLGAVNLFSVLIAVFVGIGLVNKEIDKKTIYTIVSKPVARFEFLLGKYCGLILTLAINIVIMAVSMLTVLLAQDVPIDGVLFKAIGMILLECMVITAVALLFSTFSSATLSAIFTLAIFVIGHLTADLKVVSQKLEGFSQTLLEGMYYFLPNLERFNLKGHVTHRLDVPAGDLALITAYGLAYTTFLLLLASVIFQRRDFR